MKRLKMNLIFLSIFVFIYFLISYMYKIIVLDKEQISLYVLNKDIQRGNSVKLECIDIIKVNKKDYNYNTEELIESIDERKLAKLDLKKGQILTKDLLLEKNDYLFEKDKEVIAIELDKNSAAINSRLEKGSIINLYFIGEDTSGKAELIEENIPVIDVYDQNTNIIRSGKEASSVLIHLTKEKVLKVNSYIKSGTFKLSIVK